MKRQDHNQNAFDEIKSSVKSDEFIKRRLLDNLKSKGLIKDHKMKRITIYWAAATLSALIIGYTIGKNMTTPENDDPRATYALFLYENQDFRVEDGNTLVQEYTEWAGNLAQQGQLVGAEKLADQAQWMGQGSAENINSMLTGYFLFKAIDPEEALKIARSHPHSGYGGAIELREIEKLD